MSDLFLPEDFPVDATPEVWSEWLIEHGYHLHHFAVLDEPEDGEVNPPGSVKEWHRHTSDSSLGHVHPGYLPAVPA